MPEGEWYTRGGMVCQRENGIPEREWYARGGMVYQRRNGIPEGVDMSSGWVYQRMTGMPEGKGGARYTKDMEQGIRETCPCTDT